MLICCNFPDISISRTCGTVKGGNTGRHLTPTSNFLTLESAFPSTGFQFLEGNCEGVAWIAFLVAF